MSFAKKSFGRLGLVFAFFATSGVAKLSESSNDILLYDAAQKNGVPFIGPLLPYRVYIQYLKPLSGWYLVETDGEAELGKEPAVIQPGTVLPAIYFGGKEIKQKLKYGSDGLWTPTNQDEVHKFLVLGPQPRLRTVKYFSEDYTKVKTLPPKKF